MAPVEKDHARGLNGALAAEIRAEMGVQKLSGRKLAELSKIDRLTLQRYLNAERGLGTSYIEAIAEALGVSAGELMQRAVARRDANPALFAPVSDPSDTIGQEEAQAALDSDEIAGASEFDD